jgi:AcrR family transcriptional regulator
MGVAERKGRERAKREQRITAAAREIATRDGWSAVTIRRLAEEIEYSQPVLYSHFENRDAIVAAVAVAGFREMTMALRQAASGAVDKRTAARNVAFAYLAFASEQPALYEAMFAMQTGLSFAQGDTKPELSDAFSALAAIVTPQAGDAETATEVLWAALHGLAELQRSGRIRGDVRDAHVVLLVDGLLRF